MKNIIKQYKQIIAHSFIVIGQNKWLVALFFLAFLVRLAFIPNPGFEADISFWKSWGLGPLDLGFVKGVEATNNNYPIPFTYLLVGMVKLYSFFADPHIFNEYWSNTNLLFLTVSKLPAIFADLGIAAIILWFCKRFRPFANHYLLIALYLFNPVSIIDSAWWGQVDSLGVFVFLCALIALIKNRPFLTGFLLVAAMMTKLQNMIYIPLIFVFLWRYRGMQAVIQASLGAFIAFVSLNGQFLLAHKTGRVIDAITSNADYFPLMSLNAYNLWWIVSGAKGMQTSDKLLSIGLVNAKTVGLLLFSTTYLWAIAHVIIARLQDSKNAKWKSDELTKNTTQSSQQYNNITIQQFTIQPLIPSLIIVTAGFFLFLTQSHERYAFSLIALLILWVITKNRPQQTIQHSLFSIYHSPFAILYSVFSLLYFINLHNVLLINYPKNGIAILSFLLHPIVTITLSFVFLLLFLIFVWKFIVKEKPILYLLASVPLVLALVIMNKPLIRHTPFSLTSLSPIESSQGYGLRTKDMPVNASLGFNSWSPLSVQYAFYKKGIGTHAISRITYDIGGYFKSFTTDYGIDTEAGTGASVAFEVYGDGKKLFASGKMGRFDMPRHANVNIQDVKKLTLIVTDAGDGIRDDHADWLQPTLWP